MFLILEKKENKKRRNTLKGFGYLAAYSRHTLEEKGFRRFVVKRRYQKLVRSSPEEAFCSARKTNRSASNRERLVRGELNSEHNVFAGEHCARCKSR